MKLSEWLEITGTGRSEFARRIGCMPAYVTMLCNGRHNKWPGSRIAQRILQETQGAVGPQDFLPPTEESEDA